MSLKFGGLGFAGASFGEQLKTGAIAGATSYAFAAAGDYINNTGTWGSGTYYGQGSWQAVAVHAAVGCGSSVLGGGRCQDGALSAAFSEAVTGNLGKVSFTEGLVVSAVVGGTASELGGGKFSNGAVTGAFSYLFKAAPKIYEDLVGYSVDMGSGGDAVEKGFTQPPVKGANNIGTQGEPLNPDCIFCEGGVVSRAANKIPGINAVAGLHDWMQIQMDPGFMRNVANVPLMPVAALTTYGAAFGNILNSLPGPIYIYRPPKRDENGKSVYQQPLVIW